MRFLEGAHGDDAADVERIRREAGWTRADAVHVTGSALVVHPSTGRVLLRWHEGMQRWLQVGGHAAPGEDDPLAIALREAEEETGLHDLRPLHDTPVQIVVAARRSASPIGERQRCRPLAGSFRSPRTESEGRRRRHRRGRRGEPPRMPEARAAAARQTGAMTMLTVRVRGRGDALGVAPTR